MPKITKSKVKPISCTKKTIQNIPKNEVAAIAVDIKYIYVPCMCDGAVHVHGSSGILNNRKVLRISHCSDLSSSYKIIINDKTYKSNKHLSQKKLRQLLKECSDSSY